MEPTRAESLDTLRRRTSEKWRAFGPEYLPMFVAEMDFPLAPVIKAALHEAIDLGDTGYLDPRSGGRAAARALAAFADDRWDWHPDPDGMATTTDVSVVIAEALRRLIAPGEGVIITPPVYPPFFDLVPEAGGTVVEVPLLDDGEEWSLDLEGIDRAMDAGARGVLLCNPHNPLGLVHSREALEALAAVVEKHRGFVVSDEIHAPLVHTDAAFTPYLDVSPAAAEHGIAAHSASKAFNLAGLKCALFVTAGERMRTLVRGLPEEVVFRTGLFGAIATRIGFDEGRDWLDGTIAAIEENRRMLSRLLAEQLPLARYREPRASYLAWLDLSEYGWGEDPARALRRRAGVVLSNGPRFGAQGRGFARMNIACAPEVLVEAVGKIAAAAEASA
ncbi:MAG: aminotransferase class I/II-fold pyridoxal phosphate-dependent enzyme [Microbacteriaceae bacterium]|nr:aminotransferase class I/II-fold pyridoxal phosphate-dependent enzyme [Microbacteriaceae bacterium]MCL2795689.1 aminotransferase class I/II-fold pyridoxal phosphate-dependent enzyme [Microbacteriaceae bacterium]